MRLAVRIARDRRRLLPGVPAGLGVQEAGLIGFGSILGLPPDAALTLSLVKRLREILFGIPALVSWQWAEGWKGFHYGRSRNEP